MSVILDPHGQPVSPHTQPGLFGPQEKGSGLDPFDPYTDEELAGFLSFVCKFIEEGAHLQNVIAIQLGELARLAKTLDVAEVHGGDLDLPEEDTMEEVDPAEEASP